MTDCIILLVKTQIGGEFLDGLWADALDVLQIGGLNESNSLRAIFGLEPEAIVDDTLGQGWSDVGHGREFSGSSGVGIDASGGRSNQLPLDGDINTYIMAPTGELPKHKS